MFFISSHNLGVSADHASISTNARSLMHYLKLMEMLGVKLEYASSELSCRRALALTFDDGYKSLYEFHLKWLLPSGRPSTVFAIAGAVNGDIEPTSFPYLAAEQLKELADAGVEIGCHSYTHTDLRNCSNSDLRRELVDARHLLEDTTGRSVRSFCYPMGLFDERVRDAVRSAGYERGFTTKLGRYTGEDPLSLKRIALDNLTLLRMVYRTFRVCGVEPW